MDDTEVQEWPYGFDADHDDPLTKHRIAVTNSHPMLYYLVAFDRGSQSRPTEQETLQMVAYLDFYKQRWYTSHTQEMMARRPLDVGGGSNGVIFHKWAEGDWGYRRQNFETGHLFTIPGPLLREKFPRINAPVTLEELLDTRICNLSDEWPQWKLSRPEAFDAQS